MKRHDFQIVLKILASIILGVILELILSCNYEILNTIHTTIGAAKIEYGKGDFTLSAAEWKGDTILTSSNDSWIELSKINSFVGILEVKLKQPVAYSWDIQVYYDTQNNQGFSEDKSVRKWVSKKDRRIFVELNQDVYNLRVDLGSEAETEVSVENIVINPTTLDYFFASLMGISIVRSLIYSGLIWISFCFASEKSTFWKQLYSKRWLWGICIIAFCTIFKIHGSSIDMYNDWLPGFDYTPLWGTPRHIRSDEYAVFTPMAFSQVATGFHQFNDTYRAVPTDMFMVFGQPVKSFAMIFRPFQVGYLFLGAERGLAFYWSARTIILFLISLEFGGLLLKKDKILSGAYAICLAFSPIVQWWFSINSLVEMLIFGQSALLLLDFYLKENRYLFRSLAILGLVICAGGYILCLYPAWQIPLFYVFLACAVSVIFDNYGLIKISYRDVIIIIGGVVLLGLSMCYILVKSAGTIELVTNTIYPGSRNITGGSIASLPELFKGWGNVFLPWENTNLPINECEAAAFFDLFPLSIIITGLIVYKIKGKDIWLITLGLINLFLISFILFPWPETIAKITLLNQCPINRVAIAVGLINIMLLFRSVSLNNGSQISTIPIKLVYMLTVVTSLFVYYYYIQYMKQSMRITIIIICATIFCGSLYGTFRNRKILLLFTTIWGVVAGITVNP